MIKPVERNPQFSNPLINSTSPYLRQHAHNPVFWHPWSKEAIDRAFVENKPILLSIGYSTCYWCHVMEREVFENLSIASHMNKFFINIKVDREEHPELDEIYMVARQLMTHEGGWPNNVFLTPDLKPFYAGGTYAADESYGKPAFPRLLEWINYSWMTQEQEVRKKADEITEALKPFLTFPTPQMANEFKPAEMAAQLFNTLKEHHDARAGGFFQAPKFPNECYLNFLLDHYEYTNSVQSLALVTKSLAKMAAGGIYDHVGCGFHRYAVDKEWYVPHFEKMLYNQAMLANLYTRTAMHSDSAYFADIAKSILDFTAGPLRDGKGAFYAAIDAETDQVEGAYYAWTPEELQTILSPEESQFFISFYALADIPAFPGHKHTDGKVIIARKPLDIAAREFGKPYAELAALSAQVMNKLLAHRNQRKAPHLDDKIITSWNGLMIAAYARAAIAFNAPRYIEIASKAANYILENGFDNNGVLKRIIDKKSSLTATLEDYAYLIEGLIMLWHAENKPDLLNSIEALMSRAHELFFDGSSQGYFYTQLNDRLIFRIKNGDDATLPNANAVMLHNLIQLYGITKKDTYLQQAQSLSEYFLNGNDRIMLEYATMLAGALRLDSMVNGGKKRSAAFVDYTDNSSSLDMAAPDGVVFMQAARPPEQITAGATIEIPVKIRIEAGWHINANELSEPNLIPTQLDIQGDAIEKVEVVYPKPVVRGVMRLFEEEIEAKARVTFGSDVPKKPRLSVRLRYQPCHDSTCHKVQDISITL